MDVQAGSAGSLFTGSVEEILAQVKGLESDLGRQPATIAGHATPSWLHSTALAEETVATAGGNSSGTFDSAGEEAQGNANCKSAQQFKQFHLPYFGTPSQSIAKISLQTDFLWWV